MSRNIPEDVKRQVRQKCHFGCVVCGLPVYNYDHVTPFADVQSHHADNIVLLCPTHHQEKTSGRISEEAIRQLGQTPFNGKVAATTPHLLTTVGSYGRVEVGGNTYEFDFETLGGYFAAITIRDKVVVGIGCEDNRLLFDIVLTDNLGKTVLQIERGELTVSTGVWDCRIEGDTLAIRSAERKIEFLIKFAKDSINICRGYFASPPLALEIGPNSHTILPSRNTFSGCTTKNCRWGLVIN